MTLDLDTVPPIAGESAMTMRDILRRSHGAFREDWLSNRFRYGMRRGGEIAKVSEAAGYVRRDTERGEDGSAPACYSLIVLPRLANYALGHVKRLVGNKLTVDIHVAAVLAYREDRLREGASPKSIRAKTEAGEGRTVPFNDDL